MIPLNSLLAPATNLHSVKLFMWFMCHLAYLQTSGVTPDSLVTSEGAVPEPQLACFIPYVKGAKNWVHEACHYSLRSTVKVGAFILEVLTAYCTFCGSRFLFNVCLVPLGFKRLLCQWNVFPLFSFQSSSFPLKVAFEYAVDVLLSNLFSGYMASISSAKSQPAAFFSTATTICFLVFWGFPTHSVSPRG